MPSLIDIRKKITSTKNTKKITKAMQLVAASKMKAFQAKSGAVRSYMISLLGALRLCGTSLLQTDWAETREEGDVLFVLLTSDKGLCGAMNGRLIRALERSDLWQNTPETKRRLIAVGKKSIEAARGMGVTPVASFPGLQEDLTPFDALVVIDEIITQWRTDEVKEVVMIAPEYVNPFVFNTHVRTYLPLSEQLVLDRIGSEKPKEDYLPEAAFFEPSQEEAVDRLAEQVVQGLFTEAFYELKATEYSSRMVAMKKATEAADDRIKELTNQYNKARQGAITQELSELAAANEAMSNQDLYEYTHV